jgi:hypothetical protein
MEKKTIHYMSRKGLEVVVKAIYNSISIQILWNFLSIYYQPDFVVFDPS